MLYHGSQEFIKDYLVPFSNKIVNNTKVVFATNIKWIALVCIPHLSDKNIEFGYQGPQPYIKILTEFANSEILNAKGWLYKVSQDGFQQDMRLGMIHHEFINYDKAKIISHEYVNNVYEFILDEGVFIIHKYK